MFYLINILPATGNICNVFHAPHNPGAELIEAVATVLSDKQVLAVAVKT